MMDLSPAPVMGRFSGDDPLDWVIQTEKYFIYYNILSEHKLSWASFYLDGEALEWYRWLFRNKQLAGWDHFVDKLFIRFQSRKVHNNRLDFLQPFTTTIPSWSTIANSPSPWNALSDYTKMNSAHQVFDEKLNKTPVIVVGVENASMLIKSDLEIPQIADANSVEAELVHEPSSITEGQVFDEISGSTTSSDIPELNYSFSENVGMQTTVLTSVLNGPKGSNSVEEEKSQDTVALFNKSPKRDASNPLAPFAKQPVMSNTHMRIIEIVYPIATWVSIFAPLVGREAMMSNGYLEQDMPARHVVTNSLGSGSPNWKPDLATFIVGMEDLFLANYCSKNGSVISTSVMHSVGLLLGAEKRKSIGGFIGQHILSQFPFVSAATFLMLIVTVLVTVDDFCVRELGIDFGFMALTGYIAHVEELLLLECTDKFFLIAYSCPLRIVWDPGQPGCVNSYWSNFSVDDNCSTLTCPLITYSLVFAAYYAVKHKILEVLVTEFQQKSVLHLHYIAALVGMVQVWEVKVLRSVYQVKVVHSVDYTLYEVIEIVELAACYRLHHVLGNALIFVILLNKCVVARQVITELNLIMRKSFTVIQKEHGCNWLLSVLMVKFGGRRAITIIAPYFEVNNSRFNKSAHVMNYFLYHILSALGPPFDPNSSLGETLNILLFDTATYILVNHGNISFVRKGNDAKKERNEKGIAVLMSHPCELLLENMTKAPCVAANTALTSLDDIIKYIALLNKSHISTHLCHINQQLSKNDATMSIILQAATQDALLLLTNLTVPGYAHAYSNLEDKVLIGIGGIVMNGPRSVIAKKPNTILRGYLWDPG